MSEFIIRSLGPDRGWVFQTVIRDWGAETVVAHGSIFHPALLPGFAAYLGNSPVGLLTYILIGEECEIITLNSWWENMGVGKALLYAVMQVAGLPKCKRLFLITTNNNLRALQFYQKRGFIISSVRKNAIAESRKLKPQIPQFDNEGLPIRDEIEMEIRF